MKPTSPDAHQIFEILVRENSRLLMAFIRTSIRDASTADDVWQETMIVAWQRIGDFDQSRPFAPWLRGIASRIMMAKFRKEALVFQADESTLDYLDTRFDQLQTLKGDTLDEKLEALRDCVSALPDHYRQCIELRFISGMKPQQLSEQLDVALESVKKRLVRAKQQLLTCIDKKMSIGQLTGELQDG